MRSLQKIDIIPLFHHVCIQIPALVLLDGKEVNVMKV